jgi:large subunit ribosomal protein L35
MPSIKQKTHKGIKKRFKVTATGKVTHKRCGSSHLNSHKSGKQIRRLRKKSVIQTRAVAQTLRRAVAQREGAVPEAFDAPKVKVEAAAAGATEPAPPQS